MDQLRETLAPLTNWLPEDVRGTFPVEVWWLFELVAALALLLVVGRMLRSLLSGGKKRKPKRDWDAGLRVDLENCPLSAAPPIAFVHHIPVRLRMLVVAPVGPDAVIPDDRIAPLLERLVPGLGTLIEHDLPDVVVWPAQLSAKGFANSFHRCAVTGQRDDEPSHWVLVAGKAHTGSVTVLVGLALWSERKHTLGRINIDANQWLGVLRLREG